VGLIRRRGRPLSPTAQQLYDLFLGVKGRRSSSRLPTAAELIRKSTKKA